MTAYGVFVEERTVLVATFADLGSAQEYADAQEGNRYASYDPPFEALEICADHHRHPYGECPNDIELLQRVLDGLKR